MAGELVLPGELNTHLNTAVPTARADQAITMASGAVTAYCGWAIARESTTMYVTGTGTRDLTLPTLRLWDVTDIRVDGVSMTEIPPFSWVGTIRADAAFGPDTKIEVDVDHGFDPIPDVVRLVVLTLAARVINNPDDADTITVSSVTRRYRAALTALDMRLLDTFRV